MASWRYFVHDSVTGEPVGELPLEGVQIEDVLSGQSSLTGTLGLHDASAARSLTAPWLREITAVRDYGVPGGSVIGFHGPIIARTPRMRDRTVQIAAASPHVYFYKRVTEAYNQYSRDTFSLVRDLIADATAKTGGSLYRLDVTSADSGVDVALTVGASDRRRVSQVIEELAADRDTGFDFRWDATWDDLDARLVQRTLTLGSPALGQDRSLSRVLRATADLVDVLDAEDGLTAANRVHGLGATVGASRLRSVANSGTSLAAGYPLLEDVVDLSDIKDQALLNGITTHLRDVRLPGTRNYESTFQIGATLPYQAVDLGDLVTVQLTAGVESIDVARRVVAIRTSPETDEVTFVYYDPASDA